MKSRNIESRLMRLEERGQRAEQFLAVWRKPSADVASALADAIFSHGDRVVCFEWFGDEPPPTPKWHRNLRPEFSDEEQRYITKALQQMLDDGPPIPRDAWLGLDKMTDGELLHGALGVPV